ncbi:MAG: phage integrase N-terminal SAM-like domain-containing protein, partial [Bacteroidota bacterium]
MQTVILKPLQHRERECIGIYFEHNAVLNGAIRKTAGARWTRTHKCWYVPLSKENYNKLFVALKGKAEIEQSALHKYLADKKRITPAKPITTSINPTVQTSIKHSTIIQRKPANKQPAIRDNNVIHAINAHILPAMQQALILKSYSPSTIRTYINEVGVFLRAIQHHPADKFTTQRIKDYLQYCAEKLKLTENTLHSRMNGLKFYFEQVLKREKLFWDIPRPKKGIQLP